MKKIAILFFIFFFIFTGCSSGGEKALDRLPGDYSLEDAKKDGCVTFEDIDITSGQQRWDDFVKNVGIGEPASVRLAYYYTIGDPARLDPEYYEEVKDQYPALYIKDLSYDGERYVIEGFEDDQMISQEYQYLRRFEGEPGSPYASFSKYIYYVLLNDDSVTTWEEIERGMLSSQSDASIAHRVVYSDFIFN